METAVPSTPVIVRADLDTTTAPCHDFHQYAAGGWYRRVPDAVRAEFAYGPDYWRTGHALRELIVQAPTLARTTKDTTLRAVGYFYGSCLADTTGAVPGSVGSAGRAADCFRTTRQHLDRALFELLMEYVWPPAARAESRQFWGHMKAALHEIFATSWAIRDTTKVQMMAEAAGFRLYPSEIEEAAWDSTTQWWSREPLPSRGRRRPSDVPFARAEVAASWIYRDYGGISLSPTDFRRNVAVLQAVPDTVPLPVLPSGKASRGGKITAAPVVLDVLLGEKRYEAGTSNRDITLPLSMLVPPMVDGKLDIGGWYGILGPVTGHEMSHGAKVFWWAKSSNTEIWAFAAEHFKNQLPNLGHSFDDALGLLVAYKAFKRATQGRSWPMIDGFTPEQRFFLGVAQGWRGGPATLHPLDNGQIRSRVLTNGVLSVLPAFRTAFSCRTGDPMAGGHVWFSDPWYDLALSAAQRATLAADYEQRLMAFVAPAKLTAEQQAVFAQRRLQYEARRRTVLGETTDHRVSVHRVFQVLAEEVGEARTLLTREQLTAFDPSVREWVKRSMVDGYSVEIAGLYGPR